MIRNKILPKYQLYVRINFHRVSNFTADPVAKAMLNPYKRVVKVETIPDKSQRKERFLSLFAAHTGNENRKLTQIMNEDIRMFPNI